ncbi:MAG: ABC transporter permease [Microcystis viridis Mv_BB_P_19951000_S69]|jgi:Cu-processing system permease protein|uniref:ABC transporter permease n=1 Tax=Microcystis viridis Mv_BB_P_19951000_S68D TaxID=2486270 RepID=A0A552HGK9_MICVR|nr:ABC transporter permease [Microcystis aeruginosa LG13-11]TRU70339.1 MAG: ABC transporter permease [Microcystis viridis Mv_BB_P_19951000_S68D]TRU73405.1 MAG: ABC transporter permease [Microcystis viridis Mv_BB_P_19951000_S68]TRU76636.1 MAG: ABC transporter permease [Microcystis viridis Mv_BB_P_19951000_S69]TRU80305.1 MAG: ABC transporter permease [Microcystis viridis Mv_BB_P_19951000_S69D]
MGISILRISAIAANGFREVIRDRILYLIGFFALLMAFAWRLLPEIAVGTDQKIFLDLGLAAIGLLGVIVAVFVGTGLINQEIDKRTILVLIPKPLSRAEFILGKHLGLSGVLAVMLGVMLVIYLLMLLGMKVSFQPLPLIVSVFYLGLELILIAAVAIAFGVFTSSILATLMTFGVYLMGHISKDLIQLGIISKNPNILAITKNIYLILPDLERLNFRNEAVYGLLPSADVLIANALYSLVYTGLLLGISILIFSRRQF